MNKIKEYEKISQFGNKYKDLIFNDSNVLYREYLKYNYNTSLNIESIINYAINSFKENNELNIKIEYSYFKIGKINTLFKITLSGDINNINYFKNNYLTTMENLINKDKENEEKLSKELLEDYCKILKNILS